MAKTQSEQTNRLALVVLGMHRSGTSALAGTLARAGADLPDDLMAGDDLNAKGYFESNRITGLNDDLLASAGLRFDSYDPVSPGWFASPKAAEFHERAIEAIKDDFGRSHLFILKDARICRLLPFWHKALAAAGCRPLHVMTHRYPLDVAASMEYRGHYETDVALNLWLRHVLEAEAASRGQARVFTSYKRLMNDCVAEVGRIGEGLGLTWPRDPQDIAPEMEAFLSKDLQHFRKSDETRQTRAALPGWVGETYEIMEKWAASGEDDADYGQLDRIRGIVDETAAIFGPTLSNNQEKRRNIDGLTNRISELEARLHAAQEEAARHVAAQEALEAARITAQEELRQLNIINEERLKALSQSHDALEARSDTLEKALAEVTQERDQLRSHLEQSRKSADDLHRQTLADAERIETLEASHADLTKRHEELQRRAEREARHLAVLSQQLQARLSDDIAAKLERQKRQKEDAELMGEGVSVKDLVERLKRAENHNRELLNSTSWRITAPLRSIMRRVRGG